MKIIKCLRDHSEIITGGSGEGFGILISEVWAPRPRIGEIWMPPPRTDIIWAPFSYTVVYKKKSLDIYILYKSLFI